MQFLTGKDTLSFLGCMQNLDRDRPQRFELLGNSIVVWWDANASAWAAQKDLCPHRLVPLSEGRVNERGHLECGYHGWSFNGQGACTSIPQAPNSAAAASPRACVETYACTVRQGLLWIKPTPVSVLLAEEGGIREDDIVTIPEADDKDRIILEVRNSGSDRPTPATWRRNDAMCSRRTSHRAQARSPMTTPRPSRTCRT